MPDSNAKPEKKGGSVQFAGTARRALRTDWTYLLFPEQQLQCVRVLASVSLEVCVFRLQQIEDLFFPQFPEYPERIPLINRVDDAVNRQLAVVAQQETLETGILALSRVCYSLVGQRHFGAKPVGYGNSKRKRGN